MNPKYSFALILCVAYSTSLRSENAAVKPEAAKPLTPPSEVMRHAANAADEAGRKLELFRKDHRADDLAAAFSDARSMPEAMPDDADRNERRVRKLSILLRVLVEAQAAIDPRFDPSDLNQMPAGNVAPPPPYDSGMDPAAIKDPKARKEYEQAIAANQKKATLYHSQRTVLQVRDQAQSYVCSYTLRAFPARDLSKAVDVIDELVKDKALKASLKQTLKIKEK